MKDALDMKHLPKLGSNKKKTVRRKSGNWEAWSAEKRERIEKEKQRNGGLSNAQVKKLDKIYKTGRNIY